MASRGKKVTLTLPMEQDFELVATGAASALAELGGLPKDWIDEINMAVIEACINAFEHSRSSERRVDVMFEPREDRLVIVVEDRGLGGCCEPSAAGPRQTAEGRKRGFGLKIIQEMMDDVRVESSECGTRIVMTKLFEVGDKVK